MDAVTHLLVGRLLAAGIGPQEAALGWLATAFAVLPDMDTVTWFVPRTRRWLRHRGATHTLLFGAAASVAAGALFAVAGWAGFLAAAGVAFGAFLSHVGLDVLNRGAPLLAPWRRARVEWTIHHGFRASALASALALAVLAVTGDARVAAAEGAVFALYLAARATLRLLGQNGESASGGRRSLRTRT